uniref:Uncharacterized protein n=1 Tax=Anguilla anguilla TaxID=7936 RepID=A0A0E9UF36_ANGAN
MNDSFNQQNDLPNTQFRIGVLTPESLTPDLRHLDPSDFYSTHTHTQTNTHTHAHITQLS